jgi:hypothetical protein
MDNGGTYFDVVLNENYKPVFNGMPEEIREWLKARLDDEEIQKCFVMLGQNLRRVSIADYLK